VIEAQELYSPCLSRAGAAPIHRLQQANKLIEQNQLPNAEKLLRALLAERPNHPQALYSLAQIGIRSGASEQVLPTLVYCVDQLPKEPGPLLLLAQVSADLARSAKADAFYQLLLKRFPSWPHGLFSYAGFLQTQGQLEQVKILLLKVIELDPQHSGAYLALAEASTSFEQEPLIAAMTQLLDELNRNPDARNLKRIQLHYGLGKAMADRLEYAQAFEHWRHANQLQLQACQFRVAQMEPFFEKIKEEFTSLRKNPAPVRQSAKLTPIFLVGLPRSGSTLLEQMLSRHTKIETAGEVHYLADTLVRKLEELTGKNYPQDLGTIPQERLLQLGESYLSKLQRHHPESNYIIDKLPANFQSIGLIRKALPHAVIIHLTRNPLAVGLSIFRNYFLANEPYFCDLEEFAQYYRLYRELMDFWQDSSPASYYEMSYESLVESPKEQLFRLLEFCGLEWQDECLEFYKTTNTVNTLSAGQVRQPLYQTSIDDWENYSIFLQDFVSKIGYRPLLTQK
jgi:tetratricopeptide (TPR) repeat protein